MNDLPKYVDFSIVIIHQASAPTLDRAVRSALSQMLPGLSCEVIVLTYANQKLPDLGLSEYHTTSVNLIEFERNCNQLDIYLLGLHHANGRYVKFITSWDYMADYCCLTEIVYLYDHSSLSGVGVDYWLVENDIDKKLQRMSFLDKPQLQCMAFRRESIQTFLIDKKKGPVEELIELADDASKQLNLGHLPIAFLRCSAKQNNII